MNNNWMTHLKEHSKSFTRKAPDGLLDDIKQEMTRRGIMPVYKPKKAHIIDITPKRIIAAAAIMLLITGTAVYLKQQTTDRVAAVSKASISEEAKKVSFNSQHSTLNVKHSTLNVAHGCAQNSNNTQCSTLNVEQQLTQADNAKEKLTKQNSAANDNKTESLQHSAINSQPQVTDRVDAVCEAGAYEETKEVTDNVQHITSLGVYYGNMSASSIDLGTKYGDNLVLASEPFYNSPITDYQNDVSDTYVVTPPTINKANHHQPIRVGLSLRYAISPRWSLLTGINYSYLQSDFSSYNNRTSTDKKQKLHYIGIPVNLSYTLWQKKKFNLYLIAGAQAEKLVKGQTETTTTQHNQSTTSNTENVHENKPIFSTNTSLGVEYQLGKFIGLFAEPGVSYYFKNGSGIESSYTEKPFNFNFNLGVRVNFNVKH
ncbi:MAG: PorT family protein [Prevotella sp.]|nr:PorT family protein [Prevotella sp.]